MPHLYGLRLRPQSRCSLAEGAEAMAGTGPASVLPVPVAQTAKINLLLLHVAAAAAAAVVAVGGVVGLCQEVLSALEFLAQH